MFWLAALRITLLFFGTFREKYYDAVMVAMFTFFFDEFSLTLSLSFDKY
jgi:hypothetical protein